MAIATSYGTITIVDVTDIGELSVYPGCNVPSTQLYDPNDGGFEPDWSTTNVELEPFCFYAGTELEWSNLSLITWHRGVGQNKGAAIKQDNESGYNVNEYVDHTNKKLIIKDNILSNIQSKILSYTVHIEYIVDGTTLVAEGQIDFSLLYQGTSAKTAKILGDNFFSLDWQGNTKVSGDSITLELQTSSNVEPGYTYSGESSAIIWEYYSASNTAHGDHWIPFASAKQVNPVTFTYANLSSPDLFTNDTLKIRAKTNEATLYDLVTITRLKDGAPGSNAISASLSNSDQMIPVTVNNGVETVDYSTAFTYLTVLKAGDSGTEDDTNNWIITIHPSSGVTFQVSTDGQTWTGAHTTDITGYRHAKISAITGESGSLTFTCTQSGYAAIQEIFTVTKIRAGIDGKTPTIYSLDVTAAGINRTATTPYTYTPSPIVFTAYEYGEDNNGNVGKRIYTSGKIRLETLNAAGTADSKINNSGAIVETDTSFLANTRTLTLNNNSAIKSYIKTTLLNASNEILDTQYIPLVINGDKGASGEPGVGSPAILLSDENESIPCNSNRYPSGANGFSTDIIFTGKQGNENLLIDSITITENSTPALSHFTSSIVQTLPVSSGTITLNFSNLDQLQSNGTVTLSFTSNHLKYYQQGQLKTDGTITINKTYSWNAQPAAKDAQLLQIVCKQNVFSKDNQNQTLTAIAYLTKGTTDVTDTTTGSYVWAKYAPNQSGADADGYVIVGSDTSANAYVSGNTSKPTKQLNVKRGAVDGYASFRLQLVETVSGSTVVKATQYISFIDKFDPIQVSVHSTIGTQIKNSQGQGALYARVTQTNVGQIDSVPEVIESGPVTPASTSSNDDYYVILSQESNNGQPLSYQRKATLYHCPIGTTGTAGTTSTPVGTGWTATYGTCKYHWTFRNSTNKIITQNTKLPYQYSEPNLHKNQFIYIDANLIDSKITADVEVTLD